MKKLFFAAIMLLVFLFFVGCANAESIIASGDCSQEGYTGITWQLTDDGTFTISGTGEMDSGEMDSNGLIQQPWANWLEQIKKVVVEEGITNIDNYSFAMCTSLTEVSLPEGLTTIGSEAFYNCTSLTAIRFPDSLNNMYMRAFHGCTAIRELTVPACFAVQAAMA